MNNKIILAIADGLGDLPISRLGGKTPLQAANTPTLDQLASEGACGIMDPLKAGVPVGTDMGHMLIFGYDKDDYPGRGPIEAAGIGLEVMSGDVAFRCNFSTIDENGVVLDRRAGRIRENTAELAHSLDGLEIDGVKVIFKEATEHRAVLILRGNNLSANITDTDPKLPTPGLSYNLSVSTDNQSNSIRTAKILNKVLEEFRQILANHSVNKKRVEEGKLPANAVLTRGAGQVPNIEKVTTRLGFKGACIASESTVLGAANIAGFEIISREGMTGNLDTDINLKAKLTIEALNENDFVVVHFKATDLMGHDNNPDGKINAIEKFDQMLSLIVKERPENTLITLASDHSTPCERMEHSGDPVPIVLNGKGIRIDSIRKYNEIDCAVGSIGRITASEYSSTLYDYLYLTKKQGN
jgi:2,3-bisphosphoglycerate-independent phosphoglycerate mutase